MNNDDVVIKQITEFMEILNFNKININGKDVFEHKNEYYLFTKGGKTSYFLEYAPTLLEAKNNCYEDIEAYSVRSTAEEDIIEIIKNDIINYIVTS